MSRATPTPSSMSTRTGKWFIISYNLYVYIFIYIINVYINYMFIWFTNGYLPCETRDTRIHVYTYSRIRMQPGHQGLALRGGGDKPAGAFLGGSRVAPFVGRQGTMAVQCL